MTSHRACCERYGLLLLLLLRVLSLLLPLSSLPLPLPQSSEKHFLGRRFLFCTLPCRDPLLAPSDSKWCSSLLGSGKSSGSLSLSSTMLCWRRLVSKAATTWCLDEDCFYEDGGKEENWKLGWRLLKWRWSPCSQPRLPMIFCPSAPEIQLLSTNCFSSTNCYLNTNMIFSTCCPTSSFFFKAASRASSSHCTWRSYGLDR